jgi:two-component system NarL family sensor kinase
VLAILISAVLINTDPGSQAKQGVLIAVYALVALSAAILVFSPIDYLVTGDAVVMMLTLVDIAAVVGFKILSPGGYLPLLVMGLLPLVVAIGVSWRPAAAVLAVIFVVFTAELLQDSAVVSRIGWAQTALLVAVYAFLCSTRLVIPVVRTRYEDEIAKLTASREALLADTMTASEAQRRQISESIHDGPLQDVLAARRDIVDYLKQAPAAELDGTVASLQDASARLRDVTFELHPAVLEQVGLGAAVEKLASLTADRSGITITTDIEYRGRNAIDPMAFGVVRELLSNVVRHSDASHSSVKIAVTDDVCCLDVADNGLGFTRDVAARRLAGGHIGLASQRARVEATGGTFRIIDEPVGAHINVRLPLRR